MRVNTVNTVGLLLPVLSDVDSDFDSNEHLTLAELHTH